jgi:hypothetical protein
MGWDLAKFFSCAGTAVLQISASHVTGMTDTPLNSAIG